MVDETREEQAMRRAIDREPEPVKDRTEAYTARLMAFLYIPLAVVILLCVLLYYSISMGASAVTVLLACALLLPLGYLILVAFNRWGTNNRPTV